MAYPIEQGVTVYVSEQEYNALKTNDLTKGLIEAEEAYSAELKALHMPTIAGEAFIDPVTGDVLNTRVYKYVPYTLSGEVTFFLANKAQPFLTSFLYGAATSGFSLPSFYYYAMIDDYTLKAATTAFVTGSYTAPIDFTNKVVNNETYKAIVADLYAGSGADFNPLTQFAVNPYREVDPNSGNAIEIPSSNSILRREGRLKFSGANSSFLGNYNMWVNDIRTYADKHPLLSGFDIPSGDFLSHYNTQISARVNTVRSCIATRSGEFGHYGTNADWRVAIEAKDWGYAWNKGFLEGLLVYPVTWLLDSMAYGFDPALSGVGQIWALVIVTLIVRGLLLAVSWRSTMDSQKMQALQPELTKLQNKYPNSNTNQAEKQRLAQEQMALYRRHGIKPFRQILLMIIQFPVFICVWSGLQGSAALSTGEFLNMRLSDNINAILGNMKGNWYQNTYGWWTALILFLLMATTQIMAMLLPRIIAKHRSKSVAKSSRNPAQEKQGRTMKLISYGMIIFTIIMGFFLPSAMGVYWLIGGLISIIQTLITQLVLVRPKKKGKK